MKIFHPMWISQGPECDIPITQLLTSHRILCNIQKGMIEKLKNTNLRQDTESLSENLENRSHCNIKVTISENLAGYISIST